MSHDSGQRVLKAESIRDVGAKVVYNFNDLDRQRDDYLGNIRDRAASLISEAQAEANNIREKARQEGYQRGLSEGSLQAEQQSANQIKAQTDARFAEYMSSIIPALESVQRELSNERDRWLLRWEKTAVELGAAIAAKLVRQQLTVNPELATTMISEALRMAAGQPRLHIELAPADLERLGSQVPQLVKALSGCADPEIIANPLLTSGSCRIETQHGEIDATLDTILQRIVSELLE